LNSQLTLSKKIAEEAQTKVESQNDEILATQQQLLQSEKMASLGTLTAGVAHEINNPTNFTHAAVFMMQNEIDEIKCFLKQLAGGDNADDDVINSFDVKFKKLIELAKTAQEGTQRIKVIVEDLRTFARLDDANQAEIKISELITSTVHLVETQY
jgi:C4-dicarboxylate-specific signal transduction histidine kinase